MGDETYFLASPGHAIPVDEKVYVCTDELAFPDGFCRTGSENVSRGGVKMCAKAGLKVYIPLKMELAIRPQG